MTKALNIKYILYLIVASFLLSCSEKNDNSVIVPEPEIDYLTFTEHKAIAHAMGGIDDYSYTNSYEAFLKSLHDGFKIIELDICYTSDGYPVIQHGWKKWEQMTGSNVDAPTHKEFKESLLYGKFHTLDIDNIFNILRENKNFWFMVDGYQAKDPENYIRKMVELAGEDESLLDRFILEVLSYDMYNQIESIHHFNNYIYLSKGNRYSAAGLDNNIQFCLENNIRAIDLDYSNLSDEVIEKYNSNDIKIYAYTIDNLDLMNQYKDSGVWGFFTNFIEYGLIEN